MRKIVIGGITLAVTAMMLGASAARVDVYPQSFDAGGWVLDAQFMDVMGSPYLLAHGLGVRVTDAKARVALVPMQASVCP